MLHVWVAVFASERAVVPGMQELFLFRPLVCASVIIIPIIIFSGWFCRWTILVAAEFGSSPRILPSPLVSRPVRRAYGSFWPSPSLSLPGLQASRIPWRQSRLGCRSPGRLRSGGCPSLRTPCRHRPYRGKTIGATRNSSSMWVVAALRPGETLWRNIQTVFWAPTRRNSSLMRNQKSTSLTEIQTSSDTFWPIIELVNCTTQNMSAYQPTTRNWHFSVLCLISLETVAMKTIGTENERIVNALWRIRSRKMVKPRQILLFRKKCGEHSKTPIRAPQPWFFTTWLVFSLLFLLLPT